MSRPLISCLMLTGKSPDRLEHARRAVRCWTEQTYPNCELVIVNHGDKLVLPHGQDKVRETMIKKLSMGMMRQRCVDEAKGEICVQWDDDDIHLPDRVTAQTKPLRRALKDGTGPEAVFLGTQVRYSVATNCALIGWNKRNAGIDGTAAWIRRPKYEYRDVKSQEDSIFRKHFPGKATDVVQGHRLFIRLHHGGNIMAEKFIMFDLAGRRNVWRLGPREAELLRRHLRDYLGLPVRPSAIHAKPPHRLPPNVGRPV